MSENPELDFLVLDVLTYEFKQITDISRQCGLEYEVVETVLLDLSAQGLPIERRGITYRVLPDTLKKNNG